jgi:hypothetical protein
MRERTLRVEYLGLAALIALGAAAWANSWAPVVAVALVLLIPWDEERAIERAHRDTRTTRAEWEGF